MIKPGWRHHLFKTEGKGTFTPVAWDVPVSGAGLTLDLSGPSSFDGSIDPEIPRLRDADGDPLVQNWQSVIVSERDGQIMGVSIVKRLPSRRIIQCHLSGVGLAGYPTGLAIHRARVQRRRGRPYRPGSTHLGRTCRSKPGKCNLAVVVDDTKAP
jgi:hypothetical protein